MAQDRRTWSALAALLPAGTMGLSISLASADAKATATGEPEAKKPGAAHERLDSIRRTVSTIVNETPVTGPDGREEPFLKVDAEKRLAWWGNGWHNGSRSNSTLFCGCFFCCFSCFFCFFCWFFCFGFFFGEVAQLYLRIRFESMFQSFGFHHPFQSFCPRKATLLF